MANKISLKKMAEKSRAASRIMAKTSSARKNAALEELANKLTSEKERILEANNADISHARIAGLSESMIDRLSLNHRLEGIVKDLEKVIQLPDPIGEIFERKHYNHLEMAKCRTAIGVLGVIYESRPNVTIDISALTIKSGNCAILRGGSEAFQTNQLLTGLIQESLAIVKLPPEAIQLVSTVSRIQVKKMLRLHDYIDLIIPRGGAALHQFCRENSTIPVITGGVGICHLFVDETADQKRSIDVIVNAKTQRPTVCNALDTLLVHEKIAKDFIPVVIQALHLKGVHFRLDSLSWNYVPEKAKAVCQLAQPEDWDTEWLKLTLGIKVVQNIEEAVQHIVEHSTGHSDGILTQDKEQGECFVREVDSAAVYINASTRFTDGGQFGLGAEVAISTQKLHARGPMGLQELTSYKWIVKGDYSVRP